MWPTVKSASDASTLEISSIIYVFWTSWLAPASESVEGAQEGIKDLSILTF